MAGESSDPRRRRRLVPAGRVIAIALVCFGFWLALDAKQLYDTALTSPLGIRRSAAIVILRPIAYVTNALGLARPVNGANRALGRTGTPGGSVQPVGTGKPGAPTNTTSPRVPPGGRPTTSTTTSTTSTTVAPGPPPLAAPSAAHPLTILDIGDSIGEDLGFGLGDLLGGRGDVHLVEAAVGSTGLAAIGYYDWPAELAAELKADHPQLVVVMLGGNDAQSFDVGKRYVGFATPLWRAVYGSRVATMMREATAAGAHVVWVGMPVMSPASTLSDGEMAAENAVYAAEARRHPGVLYVSSWKTLANAEGEYSEYLPNASGDLVEVRNADGIHIDQPGGTDLLAASVIAAMNRAWHLAL